MAILRFFHVLSCHQTNVQSLFSFKLNSVVKSTKPQNVEHEMRFIVDNSRKVDSIELRSALQYLIQFH